MKKLLFITASLLLCLGANAQEWLDAIGDKPVRLDDIIKNYEAKHKQYNNADAEEEDDNYHFYRWAWYWSHHTDDNGYLVSPLKKYEEWQSWEKAQKLIGASSKTTADDSKWTFQGPDKTDGGYDGLGRINIVEFHPTDTNTFWVGTAGGGAWKTTNNGLTWTAINDYFPVLGVSDIDFNPQNPNTIYLCTGDRDANDTYSVGVLKSTDDGATWNQTGLQWTVQDFRLANSLLVNPKDSNSITLGASNGIHKSYDGGQNWQSVQGGNFQEIVYHPTDTNIIYAAGLDPIGTREVYRSADGGASWTKRTNMPGNRRVHIAVTPADVSIVRAIVVNGQHGLEGIYESTDTGKTFTRIFDPSGCNYNLLASTPEGNKCGGQGWYDISIAISPIDADEMVVGGINTWYSKDGGKSWTIASQWTSNLPGIKVVHADKHYHRYHPLRKNELYECNDGGIYKTTDPSSNIWTDLTNGMGITQFYRLAVSNNASFVVNGAQDNGSIQIQSNGTYDKLTGGDGMDCQIDHVDSNIFYTSIQYGELRRTLDGGNKFVDIQKNIPGKPKGAWVTPFLLHPADPKIIIAGYKEVFVSQDTGNTWASISPKPYSANIQRLAMSPNNNDYIYVQFADSIVYTPDFGANWSNVSAVPSGNISDIHVDPWDPTHLWATRSGYGLTRVMDYKLSTGWVNNSDGLPNLPVNCIVIDSADGTKYVGNDIGVFYMDTSMTKWEPYRNDLPNVEVFDLEINYTTGQLWAATYGRGTWKSPKHKYTPPTTSINSIPLALNVIALYPNPNQGQFEITTDNATLKETEAWVKIVNMNGAIVWRGNVSFSSNGKASITASLPKGNYVVEVISNNVVFARNKMTVM